MGQGEYNGWYDEGECPKCHKELQAKAEFADEYYEDLGMHWCSECETYSEIGYNVTLKESIDGPEEGINFCQNCGEVKDD